MHRGTLEEGVSATALFSVARIEKSFTSGRHACKKG
jgi:hypothetical protein